MYWKDTPLNRNLSDALVKYEDPSVFDQHRVNDLFYERDIPFDMLDTVTFPNGWVMMWGMKNLDAAVVAHMNWLGNMEDKIGTLKQLDMWFVEDEDWDESDSNDPQQQDQEQPPEYEVKPNQDDDPAESNEGDETSDEDSNEIDGRRHR
mmetsp:Transcript_28737/g.44133  ORF Transcript_28737/g.44133 Transcript_28737/m.44133 type:complete len:149 (-) Transcript_28737:493-939(-)